MNQLSPPSGHSAHIPAPAQARLGELLLSRQLIALDQLEIALYEQRQQQRPLGELLVHLGFIEQKQLSLVLAEKLGQQTINLHGLVADPKALACLPSGFARRHQLLPIRLDNDELYLACSEPGDLLLNDEIQRLLGHKLRVVWCLAGRNEILAAIENFYDHELSIDGILQELDGGKYQISSIEQAQTYSHPLVRLVDALLADACLQKASDLHFEPEAHFLRIRYRIDGLLQPVRLLPLALWPAMLVRLKIMAGMDIAETRTPQDGRIHLSIAGHSMDFRCALQPTLHGENCVLRLLDRQRGIVALHQLGLATDQLDTLQELLARPEGLLLITGPTGSGKTTTLYSILSQLNSPTVNIMTLEDPVEYPLPGLRQTSLNETVKMNFADGVRSLLRQDPDILLIGEIRDDETARMALRAAMTGHQVFSTLHSNSAIHALPRLLDLGLSADMLAGNLIGILAQRLLRRLCPECRQATPPTASELQAFQAHGLNLTEACVYQPRGCANCQHTGYRGRTAIMELLRFDSTLDSLLEQHAGLQTIAEYASRQGYRTLAHDGLRRVADGSTSFAELTRTLDPARWRQS